MGGIIKDEEIERLLEAASTELDCPSGSDMSDIGSDDEEDVEMTEQERKELVEFLTEFNLNIDCDDEVPITAEQGRPIEINTELADEGEAPPEANEEVVPQVIPSDQPGPSEPSKYIKLLSHDHSYTSQKKPINSTKVKIFEVRTKAKKNCIGLQKNIKNKVVSKHNKTKRKNTVPNIQWEGGKDNKFNHRLPQYKGHVSVNIDGESPVDFFSKLFPDSLFEHIIQETIRYAHQQGKLNFRLSVQELKAFCGINIMMTYIKYPQCRMYWSSISGLRMNFIANTMSCNRFEEIKRFLHFENNDEADNLKSDKFWKIRPIIKILHQTFHDAKSEEENQSIDEMVIPFKGRSHLKQYIKNKPKKWGFKVWVKSSATGYVNCFELYAGKQTQPRSDLGPVGDMVVRLCHDIEGKGNKLFMDNFFISLPLIRHLRQKEIFVLGTVRLDRVPKNAVECLVPPEKLNRGYISIATSSDNLTLVRWMDTKPVHILSSYAGSQPEDTVKRWDNSKKVYVEISRPFSISQYNMFMGGVDLVDRMVAHYPHGFKNKKWYLRIIFHFINVTIVNSWHLYKIKTKQPKYPLLIFKAALASSFMAQIYEARKRGRPSNESSQGPAKKRPAPPKMAFEVRYDGIGHYPKKIDTTAPPRCHDKNCKRRTRFKCGKCDEPVCPTCMESFHTK